MFDFFFSFISFTLWNALAIWWLHYAKRPNGSYAWEAYLPPVLFNALLMTSVFQIYSWAKKRTGSLTISQLLLVCLWVGLEKCQLEWEFSWPWMNIGNGMAHYHKWIQWYEYTGTLGGTAWIWIVNLGFFNSAQSYYLNNNKTLLCKNLFFSGLKILLPIGFSYMLYMCYQERGKKIQVVVIQPNIDPYKQKYRQSESAIVNELIELSRSRMTKNTRFLLAPETALAYATDLNHLSENSAIDMLYKFVQKTPSVVFILGTEVFTKYNSKETPSESAYFSIASGQWIDVFNSALQIDASGNFPLYFKSKLVPGVEIVPYKKYLQPLLGDFLLDFGGTVIGHGRQLEPSIFIHPVEKISIAPVICYESIFGEYVSKYILKGAQLIFIITNDGWWGNSQGYKQHLAYARLRAIENRRAIARSANTGVSAFINQKGDIISALPYGEKGALSESLYVNNQPTFYSIYGDFLARFALLLGGVLFAYTLSYKLLK